MEKTNLDRIKDITYLAFGIALFVVLSMCLRVPVFENYYLCLGYIVMAVYIWNFKWYEGTVIGVLGVILYCWIGGLGFNGLPGWAAGNLVIGIILGFTLPLFKKLADKVTKSTEPGEYVAKKKAVVIPLFIIVAVIATFIGIELVKSFVDMFVVAQPFAIRFIKNFNSFVADAFVIVASVPVCIALEKPAKLRYNK